MYSFKMTVRRRVPLRWLALMLALLIFGGLSQTLNAQRPQFRKWNLSTGIGLSPLNAGTCLPTLSGHFRGLALEIAPYVFNVGAAASYQFPVWTLFKKFHFNLGAKAYFARQNNRYFVLFPRFFSPVNQNQVGLLAGPTIYFLRRFSLEVAAGAAWMRRFGLQEYFSYPTNRSFLISQGSITLNCRLFKTFQP